MFYYMWSAIEPMGTDSIQSTRYISTSDCTRWYVEHSAVWLAQRVKGSFFYALSLLRNLLDSRMDRVKISFPITHDGVYSQSVCCLSLLLCFAVRTFEGFIGISRNLLGCRSYESSRVDSPQRLLLKGGNQSTFTLAMFLRTLIFGYECPHFFSR